MYFCLLHCCSDIFLKADFQILNTIFVERNPVPNAMDNISFQIVHVNKSCTENHWISSINSKTLMSSMTWDDDLDDNDDLVGG